MKKQIWPEVISAVSEQQLPVPRGVIVGELFYLSGCAAIDDRGNVLYPGDVRKQTSYVIAAIGSMVADIGVTTRNVVTVNAVLAERSDFAEFNEAYREGFGGHTPARTTIVADLVVTGLLVEITAVAYVGIGRSNG